MLPVGVNKGLVAKQNEKNEKKILNHNRIRKSCSWPRPFRWEAHDFSDFNQTRMQ